MQLSTETTEKTERERKEGERQRKKGMRGRERIHTEGNDGLKTKQHHPMQPIHHTTETEPTTHKTVCHCSSPGLHPEVGVDRMSYLVCIVIFRQDDDFVTASDDIVPPRV